MIVRDERIDLGGGRRDVRGLGEPLGAREGRGGDLGEVLAVQDARGDSETGRVEENIVIVNGHEDLLRLGCTAEEYLFGWVYAI